MSRCPLCSSSRSRTLNVSRDDSRLCRCLECRTVHWAEGRSPDAAAVYHDYYAGRPTALSPITEQRYRAILERIERRSPPGRLLEVGCGMGHFLAAAERRGWQAIGLEVSASGREQIERLKAERGWTFEMRQGDVMEAEFATGSFRAIVLIEVLEHLPDPMACLRRLAAWLVPGGALYLTTPNFDSLSRYALAGRWRAIGTEHVCLFNPGALRSALRRSGFDAIRMATKNIDLPEIAAKWRSRAQPSAFSHTAASTEALRQTVERSLILRSAKSAVNVALRLSRLGESLEALAVKT